MSKSALPCAGLATEIQNGCAVFIGPPRDENLACARVNPEFSSSVRKAISGNDDPRAPTSFWNVVRGDFFGGVAAGVVALPLALAFGVASGLGPVAGLYGAIATGIVAAVFGGTPVQITGPTGPMTLVVAGIAATNTLPSGAV